LNPSITRDIIPHDPSTWSEWGIICMSFEILLDVI